MILFAFVIFSFVLAAWLSSRFCKPSSVFYVLDHPNPRSLHSKPTPRTGGLAIATAGLSAALSSVLVIGVDGAPIFSIYGVAIFLSVVSFMDDRYDLSPVYRSIAQFVAAALLLYAGLSLHELVLPGVSWELPSTLSAVVSILFIVWMVNLYNFMDGMDGFAGGMAVFGFGSYALLGWQGGAEIFSLLSAIVAAAAAGFLVFNFPPARIFMGDTGSSFLGLLAAVFTIWGNQSGIFPFWLAMLVFSPFIVDATVTLMRRLLRGEKVWQAHKTHYYQRLVQLGWGHRKTVLFEYLLMFGCGLTAMIAIRMSTAFQWAALGSWVAVYTALFIWIGRLEMKTRDVT